MSDVTPVSNIPISVDYTSKDYYVLRDELIARVQDRIPEWTASDPSDFGVALVEARKSSKKHFEHCVDCRHRNSCADKNRVLFEDLS